MALVTSLVIAGDAQGAVAALDQTDAALAGTGKQAQALSAAYATADKAIARLGAAQAIAKRETDAAKAAFSAGEIELKEYNARLLETKSALSLVEAEHRAAVGEIRKLSTANDQVGPSLAQARAGYTNFGRQVQDVAVMLQSGANVGTIVAMQGGQVADAVAQMGGRFSGLARIMAGPMGTAIIVLTSSLLNMAQAHWQASQAAGENALALRQVELASSGLSEAQSVLGEVFDLTTGKIKSQNELLRLNIQLQEMNLRIEAEAKRSSAQATRDDTGGSMWSYFTAGGLGEGGDTALFGQMDAAKARVRAQIDGVLAETIKPTDAFNAITEADLSTLNISLKEYREAIRDAAESLGKDSLANKIKESFESGVLDPALRREGTSKTKRARDTSGSLAEAGENAAKKIANIRDQFSDLPSAIERSNKAMRELDDIASDVARSKLPATTKTALTGAIGEARTAIEESLNRPLDQYLAKSREAVEIDRLLIAGRDAEAAALKVVLGLKDKMGPLDEQQLSSVLATVQAEERRALVLRDQRALIQANVAAVQDMRGALEQTVGDMLRGRFSVERILSSVANSYVNLTAQRVVERMFGDTLRSLEEQARGSDRIDTAATAMVNAFGKGADAVANFTAAIERAGGRIERAVSSATSSAANDNVGAANDNADDDVIVVTGKRSPKLAGADPSVLVVDMISAVSRDIGVKIPESVSGAIKSTLNKLELSLPQVMAGALTGASASRIVLGDRGTAGNILSAGGGIVGEKIGEKVLSGTLSKISSSLGGLGGPIGSVVGGVLGGLLGGLFRPAPKASAVITSTSAPASVSGNNADAIKSVTGAADNVQSTLNKIIEQLGGVAGSFSVAIGTYKDYYRVSASGQQDPSAKYFSQHNTNPDSLYDGPDASVALRIAIRNALQDGAVQDVSAAVQKALSTNSDIDKAVSDALKVQTLELAIGGVGAELAKEFKSFETTAKDRLRIARAYGLDVVKVEELNAKERVALTKKLVESQVGSLQRLVDEISYGALYEGSGADQRRAILDKIAGAKADTDAGVEGAADRLAQLLEQLNTVSKDYFGTTGGFAADQATILDQARDAIAKANQRVQDAAKATDPALKETNAQLNESNDQLARIAALMGTSVDYLKRLAANGNGSDYAALRAAAGF